MPKRLPFFLPTVAVSLLLASAAGEGQLGAPLRWIAVPGEAGCFYLGQETVDGRLYLTPNESFFPARGLKAEGEGTVADVENLNGGNSFSVITGWDEGDRAEWGLFFPETGEIEVEVRLVGSGDFLLEFGEEVVSVRSDPIRLPVPVRGRHSLRLVGGRDPGGATLESIVVTGPAARGASVLRKRWRPAAAHTRFSSSAATGAIRLWIMEMDAVPGDLGFYSPITTPFGYYGPTWNADGSVGEGFNFSLWSFGRNQPEPPLEQLSHLLAIGHPEARFGGFDHEGTGVKIRDWKPLAGRQGQRQAIALRVEPGERYDTYHSYFYASDEKRWRLFGSGRKWNEGRPIGSLWVGSFVEVPGPPPVQRTGPYRRTMRYRGRVMDEDGDWYVLDRMQNGNVDRESGYTHTDRGVTEDGWFFLTTGGWTFREPPAGGEPIEIPSTGGPAVDYLDPDDLAYLQTVPSSIEIELVERRGRFARVTLSIRGAGEDPEVVLHHGPSEGLTFFDRWPAQSPVHEIREGENQVVLENLTGTDPLHFRAFLRNEHGQFWSTETYVSEAP